jgi:hypothetical protein
MYNDREDKLSLSCPHHLEKILNINGAMHYLLFFIKSLNVIIGSQLINEKGKIFHPFVHVLCICSTSILFEILIYLRASDGSSPEHTTQLVEGVITLG